MHNLSEDTAGMLALTRVPSHAIDRCELTYMQRSSINYQIAARQHADYVQALRKLGLTVLNLPPAPALPDSTFVEDTALVLDEVAVMTSPCLPRKQEVESIHQILANYRKTATIAVYAKLEGGDVIRDDRTLYVGQSTRTDTRGLEGLREILSVYGYDIVPVKVSHCLHLSTAASCLDRDTFLINGDWIAPGSFAGKRLIEVPKDEPWAANVLSIKGCIVLPSAFPRTCELLDKLGYTICAVDVGELLKAEAGVTCMSLIFRVAGSGDRLSTTEAQLAYESAIR
ncbi:MAG TPA: arginine deiminase-related protein [Candidatus Aquilonibacter sp.]|jgi:dimethylargininase|nr:arginine deiminase-related protein [Candidatus Aquilonibacter sp.]